MVVEKRHTKEVSDNFNSTSHQNKKKEEQEEEAKTKALLEREPVAQTDTRRGKRGAQAREVRVERTKNGQAGKRVHADKQAHTAVSRATCAFLSTWWTLRERGGKGKTP